jgi:threonine/homoserine/homoserine lactone efflux protein
MEWKLLVAGVSTGLAMSAPIGAVNLLVIRTALNGGFRPALLASLGAVAADLLMSGVVVLGVGSVAAFMSSQAAPIQIIGGALLVVIGIRTAQQHFQAGDLAPLDHAANFGLTFSLCLGNPALYFGYLAVLGGISQAIPFHGSKLAMSGLVLGVGLGSFVWWLFLSFLVGTLSHRLSAQTLDRINRWSGVLVAALGFVLLMQAWPAFTAWFAR